MAESGWRLLAALSLIFIVPVALRGQESGEPRGFPRQPGALRASPRLTEPAGDFFTPHFPARPPMAPGPGVFEQMVRAAGIIFSGRVTAIGRALSPPEQATASTSVTFHVERALRGTFPGEILTIREWSGLWTGRERYHVGDKVLLFLYPPGKLGLTSPVGGAMGKFSLDAQGRILVNDQLTPALLADPILGGKTAIDYGEFARAVRRSGRWELR